MNLERFLFHKLNLLTTHIIYYIINSNNYYIVMITIKRCGDMQRKTVQRQIVLDALIKLNMHPTIEEIYTEIQKEHPSISKATVYRNLHQLAADGIVHKVSLPDGLERYEERIDQHYHFKCKICGGILDVDIGYLTDINDAVKVKYGVLVDDHEVVFSGICSKCKNK